MSHGILKSFTSQDTTKETLIIAEKYCTRLAYDSSQRYPRSHTKVHAGGEKDHGDKGLAPKLEDAHFEQPVISALSKLGVGVMDAFWKLNI